MDNGDLAGFINHRKKKYDGEVEPQLLNLAKANPRVSLQNYKNAQSKLE